MSDDIRLVVNLASLRCAQVRNATGEIWLQLPGVSFPEVGWNDFVAVVLGWWAIALQQVARGPGEAAVVQFMEGPYVVEMRRAGERLSLRALERRVRNMAEVERAVHEVSFAPFAQAVLADCVALLAELAASSSRRPDVEELRQASEGLRSALADRGSRDGAD